MKNKYEVIVSTLNIDINMYLTDIAYREATHYKTP